MAQAPSPNQTNEEKCLELIAECKCAEILRELIKSKVRCWSSFCSELHKKCTSLTSEQRSLLQKTDPNITNFDIALCTKIVRNINGIKPDDAKWNSDIDDGDHSLFSSLKKIFKFRTEVIHSPDDRSLNAQELLGLVSTAFRDIQNSLKFEFNFYRELDSISMSFTRGQRSLERLPSQVDTDAVMDTGDPFASQPPQLEEELDDNIDLEMEYSLLHRFTLEERDQLKRKIRLIRKYKSRFSPYLKSPQSDAIVVYHRDDDKNKDDSVAAEKFRNTINDRIIQVGNRRVKVKVVMYDDQRFEGSKLGSLNEAYTRSTYAFLFVTKEFLANEYLKVVTESLLMDSIENETKKWRVIPFHTSPLELRRYKLPLGPNVLKSENTYGQDAGYWRRMDKLLGGKIHEREDRELDLLEEEYKEAIKIQQEDEKLAHATMALDELNLKVMQSPRYPCDGAESHQASQTSTVYDRTANDKDS
ncbi:uncharacterized protein [Argopecten irradians]|uniref:uncharacterized protein n=1 Tax=Argopecten irradians TaxID=31199 RepID=UPI00371AEE54